VALGNSNFLVVTSELSVIEASSIGAVSLALRNSLIDARKYDHVKRMVAVSNPIWMRQSLEQVQHQYWPEDGNYVLNSVPKYMRNYFRSD
jgi:hypothetical protein